MKFRTNRKPSLAAVGSVVASLALAGGVAACGSSSSSSGGSSGGGSSSGGSSSQGAPYTASFKWGTFHLAS